MEPGESPTDDPTPSGQHRRDFIKRTAVIGAGLWAAPAILTVSKAGAAPGSPAACPCTGRAFGLLLEADVAGIGAVNFGPEPEVIGSGSDSLASVDIPGVISTGLLNVSVGPEGNFCVARSSVADLNVLGGLVTATIVEAVAMAPCDCSSDPTGTTTIADLEVGGTAVTVTGLPNQQIQTIVSLLGFTSAAVTITINRQVCEGGTTFVVEALVIDVVITSDLTSAILTTLNVVVAHADVSNCPCP